MKVKFGAMVVEGRGKLGGQVASRNRAGAYFRNKVTPVNPGTTSQIGSRNRLTGLSQGWRSLTVAQREQWNQAVGDFAKTDVFGDIRHPSGFNLYQRLNNNLLVVGQSTIDSPPAAGEVESFTSLSVAAESGTQSFSLTFAPAISSGYSVKVFATAAQSAGKNFVKSEYRLIGVIDDADTSPVDFLSEYQAKFGDITADGSKIFVRLVQVNETTGQAGVPIQAFAVIEAA